MKSNRNWLELLIINYQKLQMEEIQWKPWM
jgi:hypothetical protein